eukprot:TRINITY_DN6587_c0_g1_i1.p1 TRINITY_DN6587_c0_g1~~TRINITY_DN6587_c0_g1_i1.p1  ORF type:complete len:311 (+),score=28.45 TRINITY_DN6587_c0_g1_i1:3-935(+)
MNKMHPNFPCLAGLCIHELAKESPYTDAHNYPYANYVTSIINYSLPQQFWDKNDIQHRRNHDHEGSTPRSGPHITLIDPFVSYHQFELAAVTVSKALRQIQPFRVRLDAPLKYFSHKIRGEKVYTIWIDPVVVDGPEDAWVELQSELFKCFPMCPNVNNIGPFRPHISLGKCAGLDRTLARIAEYEATWEPIEFVVSEVHIMSRVDNWFQIRKTIQFGGVDNLALTYPSFKEVPLPPDTPELTSILFYKLPKSLTENEFEQILRSFHIESITAIRYNQVTVDCGTNQTFEALLHSNIVYKGHVLKCKPLI